MRKLIMLGVVAAFAVALAAPTAASAADVFLKIEGIEETNPGSGGGCIDCSPPTVDFNGIATCEVCAPGKPTSGTVSISTIVKTAPKNPCKVKSVSGTLEAVWNDSSISTGQLKGRFSDSKTLKLGGAFFPTDPIYPSDPVKVLLSGFPPNPWNPCIASVNAITGTMAITVR